MARQTRAQRRARRAQQQASADGTVAQRTSMRAAVRPAPQPAAAREAPRRGARRFVSESWGELKKVEWPTQNQLIQGVVVVLIACLIVGVWLYASDLVFKRLVQNLLLK